MTEMRQREMRKGWMRGTAGRAAGRPAVPRRFAPLSLRVVLLDAERDEVLEGVDLLLGLAGEADLGEVAPDFLERDQEVLGADLLLPGLARHVAERVAQRGRLDGLVRVAAERRTQSGDAVLRQPGGRRRVRVLRHHHGRAAGRGGGDGGGHERSAGRRRPAVAAGPYGGRMFERGYPPSRGVAGWWWVS